ncbi:MAG: EFR1 family ferrodoxin [Spirochaetales bacterium]|nr:EFR1 family ferrodoxin [Spirochaetales bacterium]
MSIEIYYFSGTGNSLFVAKEISSRLEDSKLIPIVQSLKKSQIKTSSDIVGFIFPNFCLTLPIPMRMFLDRADLGSSKYLFAVCTRGGTESEAFEYIDKLLKKQNKKLNAKINVTMPWNHPLGKENLTSESNIKRLDDLVSAMYKKLDIFVNYIKGGEDYSMPDTDADYKIPDWAKLFLISKTFNYESHRFMYQNFIKYYSDSKCKGCGICEKVCLSGRIHIIDGKPHWSKNPGCFGCFTCINYCPQKAIQIKSKFPVISSTYKTGRYHHPDIGAADIAAQK